MNIPINKNIDNYKDDFFKGLTMRQSIYSIATLVVGAGAFFVSGTVAGLPQMVSIYITMLFAIPTAVVGFVEIHGMTALEYIKKKKGAAGNQGYFYESEESAILEEAKGTDGKAAGCLHALMGRIKKRASPKPVLEAPESISVEEAERWLND